MRVIRQFLSRERQFKSLDRQKAVAILAAQCQLLCRSTTKDGIENDGK